MSYGGAFLSFVTPAKAGVQTMIAAHPVDAVWIPAFAGMTGVFVADGGAP